MVSTFRALLVKTAPDALAPTGRARAGFRRSISRHAHQAPKPPMRHRPRAGRLISLTMLLLTSTVATVTTAPAPAAASTTVTPMVASFGAHTCELVPDGTVRCWGENNRGQLGDGTTTHRSHPVAVVLPDGAPLTHVVAITVGSDHTCALLGAGASLAGSVRCWGANNRGQLGDGTTTNRLNPVDVLAEGTRGSATETPLTAVTAISAGGQHTCAVLMSGEARCWGANDLGQLGRGFVNFVANPNPVAVSFAVVTFATRITTGFDHSCATVTTSGDDDLYCWGANNFGQLGNGTRTSTSPTPPNPTPTPVRLTGTSGATLTDITSIAPGNQHTCALAAGSSGTTVRRCWGRNDVGQLGAGTITNQELNPVPVLLIVQDRAGILALDAPSCTATFSTVDGPFAELTAPSAFDVEVTYDRTALIAWVTALTTSGTGGPLETLWGIDPADDLRLVETALAVRPVSATAAGDGAGTSGAVVPTVAVAGTEMHDLTRTLFGPNAPTFDLAVNETVMRRYLRGSDKAIDDYPTRFADLFLSSPHVRSFSETELTTPLDAWGLAPVDTARPFRPEVVLSLRLATGDRTADEQMVVVLPCGGPATVVSTPPVTPPAITPDEPEGTDADELADDAPAPRAVVCSNVSVGVMSCGLTGGEPFETVSWQAAFNPVFASGTLQLDENGAGTLTFDIPDDANGRPVLVTIDGWDVSTITVASVPIPDSIPAGEGRGTAAFLFWWFLALLAGGVLSLRLVVFRRVS